MSPLRLYPQLVLAVSLEGSGDNDTFTHYTSLHFDSCCVLETMGMLPKTVAAEMPSRFKRHSMSSKKRVNCEKTSASETSNGKHQKTKGKKEQGSLLGTSY